MSELEFWKDLGNIFDAVMNYQKKNVEFNNRFINPWIRLGNVFDKQDQANDAVQAYKRATEIDPDSAQNWVELGDAQFKKGDYDQAIEAYGKAVTLDPEAGWPLGNLALSLVTQGRVEEAIPLYQKSIELLTEVKDKAICWNRLGNAYRKLNDYENAFLSFQKADQLDGENTGFSDKLDETSPSVPVVAPEEILDQMVVDQAMEETEPATPEVANTAAVEAAEEPAGLEPAAEMVAEETAAKEEAALPTIETVEAEVAVVDAVQVETAAEVVALGPNMAMVVEEETVSSVVNEDSVEEPASEGIEVKDEVPTASQEKKFDIIQTIEDVIAKVEQAYAERKNSNASEEKEVENVSTETEMVEVYEEVAREVEALNAASEELVLEMKSLMEASEKAEAEVEAPVMSETAPAEEVTAPLSIEEPTAETQPVTVETTVEVEAKDETPTGQEEQASEEVKPRIPDWLVINNMVKPEKKEPLAAVEAQPEPLQDESVTTISEISQEVVVNESNVNMEIVETYTDSLTTQLTTEAGLTDEAISNEVIAQTESQEECEAGAKAQEVPVVEESTPVDESPLPQEQPVAVVEDAPTAVVVEQTNESAYEEFLKDVAKPVGQLNDQTEEIKGEAPLTKVSQNGEVRIAMDTKNAHVWNELGNIYLNAGTYDDAIASYSKAIELDRNFAWPYSNLALAYVQKGRYTEAILLYQRGIELFASDRDKAITWNRLGNVYRRINDYNNAIASYQTADELDPENATLSLRSSFGLLGNMYPDSKPAYIA